MEPALTTLVTTDAALKSVIKGALGAVPIVHATEAEPPVAALPPPVAELSPPVLLPPVLLLPPPVLLLLPPVLALLPPVLLLLPPVLLLPPEADPPVAFPPVELPPEPLLLLLPQPLSAVPSPKRASPTTLAKIEKRTEGFMMSPRGQGESDALAGRLDLRAPFSKRQRRRGERQELHL
jgi:hypothetical protein